MIQTLARNWWVVLIRAGCAVLFGIITLFWPDVTITVLVLLFGAYALIDGAAWLAAAVLAKRGQVESRVWLGVKGVAGVTIGIVTFVWPGITAYALVLLIAFWAIISGLLEIVTGWLMRRSARNEWLIIVAGALTVVIGLLLLVRPDETTETVAQIIGAFALIFGLVLIPTALRLRALHNEILTS
jgi:uncharacterized membrane protein HdeD (DUF308 family)